MAWHKLLDGTPERISGKLNMDFLKSLVPGGAQVPNAQGAQGAAAAPPQEASPQPTRLRRMGLWVMGDTIMEEDTTVDGDPVVTPAAVPLRNRKAHFKGMMDSHQMLQFVPVSYFGKSPGPRSSLLTRVFTLFLLSIRSDRITLL